MTEAHVPNTCPILGDPGESLLNSHKLLGNFLAFVVGGFVGVFFVLWFAK